MNRLIGSMALGLMAVPIFGAASLAEDFSAGKKVESPAVSRSVAPSANLRKSTRNAAPERSQSTSRDLPGMTGKSPSLRMVVRSHDGKQRTVEPSQRVLDAAMGGKKAENQRDIIGRDSRRHVKDTMAYPNITVGLLQSTNTDPEIVYNCTATLIGPSIAITAANCVYDHNVDGGWLESTSFWPAMNGEDTMPFGAPEWSEMYVPEEYIQNYDGSYDSIWPYDVAIIVFTDPIGQDTGWMGYNSFPEIGTFDANLVGYGEGDVAWQQYASSCKVLSKNLGQQDLLHSCDADYMSTGAALYIHDASDDSSTVAAINQGGANGQNWALRITEPMAQWIDDLNAQ